MKNTALIVTMWALLGLAVALLAPKVSCAGGDCTRTFCGTSAECVGGCVCVVPIGRATGYCMPTR